MSKRILVRVVGFSDVERHALNTMFRLSQEPATDREVSYEAWLDGSVESAELVLIDGSHGSAAGELAELRDHPDVGLIWVGSISPAKAWRTFSRPLRWPDVLTAMDMYFAPQPTLDIDLDSDDIESQIELVSRPVPLFAFDAPAERRALIADADRQARLYLRSKLAAQGITHVDEAGSVADAQALLAQHRYQLVSVDLELSDLDPWSAISQAPKSALRWVTGSSIGLTQRLTAKVHGCSVMEKPLDPVKLQDLLQKI